MRWPWTVRSEVRRLNAGETLVVRILDSAVSPARLNELRDQIANHVPDGAHVIVLDNRTEFGILRGEG